MVTDSAPLVAPPTSATPQATPLVATTSPVVIDSVVGTDSSIGVTPSPSSPPVANLEPVQSVTTATAVSTPQPVAQPVPAPQPEPDPVAAPETPPSSVIDVLVRANELSTDQRDQLEQEHVSTGKPAEQLLEEHKFVSEEALTKARAEFYSIPFVSIAELGVSPEALGFVPESVARRYSLLPFAVNKPDNTLMVAMANPLDLPAIDFVSQKTGFRVVVHYATTSEVERTIAERYAQSLSSEVTQALQESPQAQLDQQKLENISSLTNEVIRQAPITKIVETILSFAIKARASDIHIEPQEMRTRVRYRIDGILQEKLILPKNVQDAVVSRIKILSDLKIDEKRIPQDGRFSFSTSGQEVDLRVSTLPTIHGEKIVMRILQKDQTVPSLTELGLRDLALQNLEKLVKVPHGIILVTGPTGSGKTTTLYSLLHKINTPKVNIMTLEDPVEYQMQGINQVQINPQAGLTFASGLRSFLRQDPNIIMVGEIRDSETVELAVQASLTGHLVFSTLHTSSAAGAIPRLLDMGAEPFLLASSLTLTMAQRVVRKINVDYREEYTPEPAVIEDVKQVLGPHFERWCKQNNKSPDKVTLFRPSKDRPPTESEYHGRVAIFEVLPISEEVSKMIIEHKPEGDIERAGTKNGMLLMKQDGYLKALEGITTIEEVIRVAQI